MKPAAVIAGVVFNPLDESDGNAAEGMEGVAEDAEGGELDAELTAGARRMYSVQHSRDIVEANDDEDLEDMAGDRPQGSPFRRRASDDDDGVGGFAAMEEADAYGKGNDNDEDEDEDDLADMDVRRGTRSEDADEEQFGNDGVDDSAEGREGSTPLPTGSPFGAAAAGDDALDSKHITDVFPELAAEYKAAGDANDTPVEGVLIDSSVVATWRCPRCEGLWKCGVFVRCALKSGCPACATARHPTVAQKRPDLVPLWDTTRNDPFLPPEECPADSAKAVHWLCPTCSQGFVARVKDRVLNKRLCPSCAMVRMQSADVLAQEESTLLQEWHPLKNGDLRLDQVQPTDSKTKIWWLCSFCGHDWQAALTSRLSRQRRSKGSVCPVCRGKGSGGL